MQAITITGKTKSGKTFPIEVVFENGKMKATAIFAEASVECKLGGSGCVFVSALAKAAFLDFMGIPKSKQKSYMASSLTVNDILGDWKTPFATHKALFQNKKDAYVPTRISISNGGGSKFSVTIAEENEFGGTNKATKKLSQRLQAIRSAKKMLDVEILSPFHDGVIGRTTSHFEGSYEEITNHIEQFEQQQNQAVKEEVAPEVQQATLLGEKVQIKTWTQIHENGNDSEEYVTKTTYAYPDGSIGTESDTLAME